MPDTLSCCQEAVLAKVADVGWKCIRCGQLYTEAVAQRIMESFKARRN